LLVGEALPVLFHLFAGVWNVVVLFAQVAIGEVADAAAEDVVVGFGALDFEDLLAVYGETAVVFDVVDEFQYAFVAHPIELLVVEQHTEIADADALPTAFQRAFDGKVIGLLVYSTDIVHNTAITEPMLTIKQFNGQTQRIETYLTALLLTLHQLINLILTLPRILRFPPQIHRPL
jgi:hypothetical protein